MVRPDPLTNPEPLIRRVYAYAAYRLGDGPNAEDATSDTFERALRYRHTYDRRKGEPISWLLGIARRCVDDVHVSRAYSTELSEELVAPEQLESEALERITVRRAVMTLDERERELVALRYGADLTAKQIGQLLGVRTNTIEVALHRALRKLRAELDAPEAGQSTAPDPVEV